MAFINASFSFVETSGQTRFGPGDFSINYRGIFISDSNARIILSDLLEQPGMWRKVVDSTLYQGLYDFYNGDSYAAMDSICNVLLQEFIDEFIYGPYDRCNKQSSKLLTKFTQQYHLLPARVLSQLSNLNVLKFNTYMSQPQKEVPSLKDCATARLLRPALMTTPYVRTYQQMRNSFKWKLSDIAQQGPPKIIKPKPLRSIMLLTKLRARTLLLKLGRLSLWVIQEVGHNANWYGGVPIASMFMMGGFCVFNSYLTYYRNKLSRVMQDRFECYICNRLYLGYTDTIDKLLETEYMDDLDVDVEERCARHEMDTVAGDKSERVIEDNNVAIGIVNTPDVQSPTVLAEPLLPHTSTDVVSTYRDIQEREYLIGHFEWTQDGLAYPDSSSGKTGVFTIDTLDQILETIEADCNNLNTMPFRFYMYGNFDQVFKVVLNSNKYQYGQLQVAFNYLLKSRPYYTRRLNKYSVSQMHHCVLDAGANNECVLEVPYANYSPRIPLRTPVDSYRSQYIGTLIVNVINPLRVIQGPTKCSGSIFVKFMNGSYTGMLDGEYKVTSDLSDDFVNIPVQDGKFAFHEMNQLLPMVGKLLLGDENRDNPPDDRPPNYFVPTASHSWCLGNNQSQPLHMLRLSANRLMPTTGAVGDDMKISDLTRTWGLVDQLTWNSSHAYDTQLACYPAAGLWPMDCYSQASPHKNEHQTYYLPPISVAASHFLFEGGTIELRFDIVSSQFHNGRLLIAYIPGWSYSSPTQCPLKLKQLRNYSQAIVSIEDNKRFVYTIPYINNNAIRYTLGKDSKGESQKLVSGMVVVKVLNCLTCVANEKAEVMINVYMRGGEDYQLFVPKQSSVFSHDLIQVDPTLYYTWPRQSEHSWYFGNWHNVSSYCIMRWGTASDQVSEWVLPGSDGWVVALHPNSTTKAYVTIGQANPGPVNIIGVLIGPYDGNYNVCFAITPTYTPQALGQRLSILGTTPYTKFNEHQSALIAQTIFKASSGGPWLSYRPSLRIDFGTKRVRSAKHEMDDGLKLNHSVSGYVGGSAILGETFTDIKDYLRRYVFESTMSFKLSNKYVPGKIAAVLPVQPRLVRDSLVPPYYQRIVARDSFYTNLTSGYTFFEGGLRKRLVFASNYNLNVIVEHRPDSHSNAVQIVGEEFTALETADMQNLNYAYYIQNLNVNPIVELSIPMYNPNAYLTLFKTQTQNPLNTYSLGSLYISFIPNSSNTEFDIHCNLFSSLEDDSRFHLFQGFPPMAAISEVGTEPKVALHEGLLNYIKQGVVSSVSDSLAPVMDEVRSTISDSKTTIQKDILHNLVVNIAHCAAAQNIKNYCIAIVSFLVQIGLVCKKFIDALANSLHKLFGSENVSKTANHEGFVESEEFSTLVSLLWCSACAVIGVVISAPVGLAGRCAHLLNFTGTFSRSALFLSQLFSRVVKLVKYIYDWVICRTTPGASLEKLIDSDSELLIRWGRDVQELTHPNMLCRYEYDGDLQTRVYYSAYVGQIIFSQLLELEKRHGKTYQPIHTLYNSITNLRNDLISMGKHPNVRRTPFCIWVYGSGGCGKSTMYQAISSHLLRLINYRGGSMKTFTLNATSDHWNGCKDQPVVYIDDYLSVASEEMLNAQISWMYQIMTNAVLCPPMAALEEKKLRYAPEILYINSNVGFANYNMITDQYAFHRRRNVLVKCELDAEFLDSWRKNINDIYGDNENYVQLNKIPLSSKGLEMISQHCKRYKIPSPLDNFEHLKFYFHTDATDPQSISTSGDNYKMALAKIGRLFSRHHNSQQEIFKRHMADEYEFVCRDIDGLSELAGQIGVVSASEIDTLYKFVERKLIEQNVKIFPSLTQFVPDKCIELAERIKKAFVKPVQWARARWEAGTDEQELVNFIDTYLDNYNPFSADLAECKFIEHCKRLQSKVKGINKDIIVDLVSVHRCDPSFSKSGVCMYSYDYPKFDPYHPNEALRIYNRRVFNDTVLNNLFNIHCELPEFCVNIPAFANYDVSDNVTWLHFLSIFSFIVDPMLSVLTWDKTNGLGRIVAEMCALGAVCRKIHNNEEILKSRTVPEWKPLISPKLYVSDLQDLKDSIRDIVGRVWDWLKEKCHLVWKIFVENWYIIRWIIGIVGVIMGAYVGTQAISTMAPQQGVMEGGPYVTSDPSIVKALKPVALCEGSAQQINQLWKLLKANTVFLVVTCMKEGQAKELRARCLVISNCRVLIIRHYLEELHSIPNGKWYLEFLSQTKTNGCELIRVPFNIDNYIPKWYKDSEGNYNLGILDFGKLFPNKKDIKNLFVTYGEHNSLSRSGYLYAGDLAAAVTVDFDLDGDWTVAGNKPEVATITLTKCYKYNKHGPGMCGTLLVSENLSKIVGIHVAGISGQGLAQPLWSSMFEFKNEPTYNPAPIPYTTDVDDNFLRTTLLPVASVPNPYAHAESGITKIMPTPIAPVFPITTQPAPLDAYDPRLEIKEDPKIVGCQKHGKPVFFFDHKLIDECAADLNNLILSKAKPLRTPKPLTVEEVVCGLELPFYEPIEMSTSEGFPLMYERKALNKQCKNMQLSGKRYLFDIEEAEPRNKLKGVHPKLEQLLRYDSMLRSRNIIPATVFVDCLKDARIPLEKVPIVGKTRIFSISPVQFTIQFGQLFNDFRAAYMNARFDVEHAIGMNVFSDEWTALANLIRTHPNFSAADYSNFGPSIYMYIAEKCIDIMINWSKEYGYGEAYLQQMEVMKLELLNSKHLCKNLIYNVICGIPSGSPITTPLNSMVNSIYIRYVYMTLAKQYNSSYRNFLAFYKHLKFCTFGDDVIMSVSDEIAEWFNTYTMHVAFKNCGMNYTDASKSGTPKPFIPFQELTFLKSYFIPHPYIAGKYLPGLDKASITDCCNWMSKIGLPLENTLVNAQCSLRLAFGWGPDYYNYIKNAVSTAIRRKLNIHFTYFSWEDLNLEWMKGEYRYIFDI